MTRVLKPDASSTTPPRRRRAEWLHRTLRCAITLAAAVSAVAVPSTARAQLVTLGSLGNYGIFGLANGSLSINSATSITGNVGYGQNVAVPSAQKVDVFTGRADLYSGATTSNFAGSYVPATFAPSAGIHSGNTSGCTPPIVCDGAVVDARLNQGQGDAASLQASLDAHYLAGPVTDLGTVSSDLVLTGTGGDSFFDVFWDFNGNTLTLNGGPDDIFVFRSSGIGNSWAQSQTILNGVSPNNVFFYFTSDDPGHDAFLVNKAETVFAGNIFAPDGAIEYHNPATFNGRIIAKYITLHSDFNLTAPPAPPTTVPEPSSLVLLGTGLAGLVGTVARRRRQV